MNAPEVPVLPGDRTAQTQQARRWSLVDMPWERLHEYRRQLQEEEIRTSFWRRIIQGRLDLLETDFEYPIQPDRLARAIRDSDSSYARRTAFLRLTSDAPFPAIGDMDDLWTWTWEHPTPEQREVIRSRLLEVERKMSKYREGIHRNLDDTTRELIRRYKKNPALIEVVLPQPPSPHLRHG